jgi:hypothetical protein
MRASRNIIYAGTTIQVDTDSPCTLAPGSVRIPPCDNSDCVMSAFLHSIAMCIMYVDSDWPAYAPQYK